MITLKLMNPLIRKVRILHVSATDCGVDQHTVCSVFHYIPKIKCSYF